MIDEYITPTVEIVLIEDVLRTSRGDEDELPGTNPFDDW